MFVRKKRAPARKGKAGKKRAKAPKPRGGLHLPAGLEQRHLDLIGLFLVAFGVYLVFVLFLGWEGGKVGYGVETGLHYLFGEVGARIFTISVLLTGGMLLTGTSVSALARGIGRALGTAFRGIFRGGDAAARTVARTHMDWRGQRQSRSEAETVAGATDVMSSYPDTDEFEPTVQLAEAPEDEPALGSGAAEDFDRELEEISTSEEDAILLEAAAVEPEQVSLTPMGQHRGVTTSEEIDYRPPSAKVLDRGKNSDKGPDPRDHESRRPQVGRDPRALRHRGEDRRRRQRAPRVALRTAAGPGDQGEESDRAGQ